MQDSMGITPFSIKIRYGLREKEYTAHKLIKNIVENCTPPQLITLHPRSKFVAVNMLIVRYFSFSESNAIQKQQSGIMCRNAKLKLTRRRFRFGFVAMFTVKRSTTSDYQPASMGS